MKKGSKKAAGAPVPIATGQVYELYRNSTLGHALTAAVADLVSSGQLPDHVAQKVMAQFDKSITEALATKVNAQCNFKGHATMFRLVDNVWTFEMDSATFKIDASESLKVDGIKVVACDGRPPGAGKKEKTKK